MRSSWRSAWRRIARPISTTPATSAVPTPYLRSTARRGRERSATASSSSSSPPAPATRGPAASSAGGRCDARGRRGSAAQPVVRHRPAADRHVCRGDGGPAVDSRRSRACGKRAVRHDGRARLPHPLAPRPPLESGGALLQRRHGQLRPQPRPLPGARAGRQPDPRPLPGRGGRGRRRRAAGDGRCHSRARGRREARLRRRIVAPLPGQRKGHLMHRLLITALALVAVLATAGTGAAAIGTSFPAGFDTPTDASLGTPVIGFGAAGPVERTPVILLHGNNDTPFPTVCTPFYGNVHDFAQYFADHGYSASELWALGYEGDQCDLIGMPTNRSGVAHSTLANVPDLRAFVHAVLDYTGAPQVDIVAHSLGVTLTRAWLREDHAYRLVRRFVAIDGPNHGIVNCSPSPANYWQLSVL